MRLRSTSPTYMSSYMCPSLLPNEESHCGGGLVLLALRATCARISVPRRWLMKTLSSGSAKHPAARHPACFSALAVNANRAGSRNIASEQCAHKRAYKAEKLTETNTQSQLKRKVLRGLTKPERAQNKKEHQETICCWEDSGDKLKTSSAVVKSNLIESPSR